MGVFVKDTEVLYASANRGWVDVNGEGELPPALPATPWAQYEGLADERGSDPRQWDDIATKGVNDSYHHITLTDVDAGDWSSDHLTLTAGTTRYGNGTIYDDPEAATPVLTTFSVDNGYTFNALIKYKSDGTKNGSQGLDVLFSPSAGSSNNRTQLNIGQRDTEDANKIRISTNTGSWEFFGTEAVATLGTKLHLLTWAVSATGREVRIFIDGVLGGEFEPSRTLTGTSGLKLYFFAGNIISAVNSNRYNFVGDVYAMSIYQRALNAQEVGEVYKYYKKHYNAY